MNDTEIRTNNLLSETNEHSDRISEIRQWADLNTDALLDSGCKIFRDPLFQGFIGYRQSTNYVVVYGDPVCAPEDKIALARSFKEYCSKQNLEICYTIVSEKFAGEMPQDLCPIKIEFGQRLVLNPSIDPLKQTGSKAVLLRKKIKHATRDGVVVSEYVESNPDIEKCIEAIGGEWLRLRKGPQVHIAHLNIFSDCEGKRWFIAKVGEAIVGFLVLNQLKACSGWLMNNLIVTENAPVGTSELLVISAFHALEQEGCTQVVVGPTTSIELHTIVGLGSISSQCLKLMFKSAKKMFRLDGQTQFWEKFQPSVSPSYILFESFNLKTIRALMKAFNVHLAK